MKIHIFSSRIEVLEFGEEEMPGAEELGRIVQRNLIKMGFAPWPSVELEVFTYRTACLVFASPAKIYVPDFLKIFAGGMQS